MQTPVSSTVTSDLSAKLRRDIVLGVIPPGARLNIEAIKRERKVSHPTIREALAHLAGEGYVTAEDNKGFRVLASSLDELHDISRLRAELEQLGLRWSIARTSTDWRSSVVAAHHALSEAEAEMAQDPANAAIAWDERNRQFHLALIGKCASPRLIQTVSTLYDLTRRYRLMAHAETCADQVEWLRCSADEHVRLRDHALAGNADAACALLGGHITTSAAKAGSIVFATPHTPEPGT